ncbi:single-stranded DNA-binding protein [Falsarthrobacter nasiphocae]|uniref:Single-stranded DNA-binding protein n=1 Tax=Falsarthrobacter nasiphocae TaxID=189863 RepID=A0AAE4C7V2_9MICC|nr:single-stranded DNA-binding protein [Falsarthrobacter nasiphocae]MDR6892899.1 single-strand DNA-binding protein [Falsarthrobacter nasiphocae]
MSHVVLHGVIGTDLSAGSTALGTPTARFRLATQHRFYRPREQDWMSGPTSWVTVQAYRRLAQNAISSLSKGDRVVVTGRLTVRDWAAEDGRRGRAVEIIAESIGPDLRFTTCAVHHPSGPRNGGAGGGASEFETADESLEPDVLEDEVDRETGEIYDPAASSSAPGEDQDFGEGPLDRPEISSASASPVPAAASAGTPF